MKLKMTCMALWLAGVVMTSIAPAAETVKLTGWFACSKCTAARVARGDIHPSNPVCAKECIDKGDDAVFLNEQGKESLKIRKYAGAIDDLGYHVEVTGVVDRGAKTITIESVKRLSYERASCARVRPGQAK